jgi:hypothetical protein
MSIEPEPQGRTAACIEDGFKVSGSNLVRCDSSRSRVREYLVGAEKARLSDSDIKIITFHTHIPPRRLSH